MDRAVVILGSEPSSSLEDRLGVSRADELYRRMLSGLVDEHGDEPYDLFVHFADEGSALDAAEYDDAAVLESAREVLDVAEDVVLISGRSLVDSRKVQQVFEQLDRVTAISSFSPRDAPALLGVRGTPDASRRRKSSLDSPTATRYGRPLRT
ncbi:hypothetical protein [Halorussus caseinilyticus]|uniref:Uncharacterized protein n=1 Tax=Halorussus caseinilyticus TaxID=3034025 RepID=A0ABD5WN63_9EURY|nr:hypothetical protein [Halorussus sp. DT72]